MMRPRCHPQLLWGFVPTVALALTGCFSMTLYSGLEPARSTPRINHRWHHSFLFGCLDGSPTTRLDEICPNGWSMVEVKTTALQGTIRLTSAFLYTPQEVTITCAEGTADLPKRKPLPKPPSVP
jgi:hypothetical protein